jgi:excisionase family DNA binding protein
MERLSAAPDVLTPRDLMQLLRIGRTKVYQDLRSGAIPSLRLGRRFLVPRAALLEMLRVPRGEAPHGYRPAGPHPPGASNHEATLDSSSSGTAPKSL